MPKTIYTENLDQLFDLPPSNIDLSDIEYGEPCSAGGVTMTSWKKGHGKGRKLSQQEIDCLQKGYRKWQTKWYEENPNYKDKWKKYERIGRDGQKPFARKQAAKNNTTTLTCPHCGKETNIGNAKRWHFDNCGRKRSFSRDEYGRFDKNL